MCIWTMLQLVVSFAAGVYCGTEYNLRPYVDELKRAASRLEKRPVEETPPPVEKTGWFGWKKEAEKSEKKET